MGTMNAYFIMEQEIDAASCCAQALYRAAKRAGEDK